MSTDPDANYLSQIFDIKICITFAGKMDMINDMRNS